MDLKNFFFMVDEGVATLTINRPKLLNALNTETFLELDRIIDHCIGNENIRVLIITGAGHKAFVVGADIREVCEARNAQEVMTFVEFGNNTLRKLELMDKPVIAAVNGLALGGGAELAAACDLRFASKNAIFGTPEINLGTIPGWGGTQRLARLVGMGLAKELILSGESISAQRAFEIGFVNKVFEPQDLLVETWKYAKGLTGKAPFTMKMAKWAINYGYDLPMDNARNFEIQCACQCFNTEECRAGIKAFFERKSNDPKN